MSLVLVEVEKNIKNVAECNEEWREHMEFVVPTLMGLESFTARELKRLGYETKTEDGRVTFSGAVSDLCRANMFLRTGERVLIKVAEFNAFSFEELFQNTKAVEWADYLDKDAAFPVKGHSLKSQLASVRDCQAIIKKAIATKMSEKYSCERLPEEGTLYQIQFHIYKDRVTLMIDTSGEPLHKRGYRIKHNAAPLRETIAASIVMLSYWKFEDILCDPFCGSGTIPIEAAMFKKNIAPGKNRHFAAEEFSFVEKSAFSKAREEAFSTERDLKLQILASDIDKDCIKIAQESAENAGVLDDITFKTQNALNFTSDFSGGTIMCNPPYGERLSDRKECEKLYSDFGKVFKNLDNWSMYLLTSNEGFENLFGKRADKKRKLYNGMIKCNLYQYFSKRK